MQLPMTQLCKALDSLRTARELSARKRPLMSVRVKADLFLSSLAWRLLALARVTSCILLRQSACLMSMANSKIREGILEDRTEGQAEEFAGLH